MSVADQFRAKYGGNRQKEKAANNKTKTSATAGGDKADTDVETLLAEVTKQVRGCCVEIRYPRSQTHNKRTCITKTSTCSLFLWTPREPLKSWRCERTASVSRLGILVKESPWSFYFLVISTGCVIMKLGPVARNRPLSTAVWAENLENLFSFWPFFDDAVRLDFLTNRWSYKKAKWLSMLFITFNSVLRFSAGKDHFFTRSRRQTWEIVWTNHKPPQLPLYAGK